MTTWVIISWVVVAILIAINVVVFLRLKKIGDQMLKIAAPGAKNMNEAVARIQQMSKGARGGQRGDMDAQLRAAMDMLQQIQKGNRR